MENKLLILESFAFTLESLKYAEAERNFQESLSAIGALGDGCGRKTACENTNAKTATAINTGDCTGITTVTPPPSNLSLSAQVALAREHIIQSLTTPTSSFLPSSGGVEIDPEMRTEIEFLKKKVENLDNQVKQLTEKLAKLEVTCKSGSAPVVSQAKVVPPPKAVPDKKVEDDDDVDLFGSDEEEDAEAKAHKEKLLADYQAKKSKKPAVIAKSNVILDIKPWDDETDMKELEKAVRSIVMDGLLWGTSKLVPVGYGIKKLQIATVVEDDKVSIDELSEKIQEFEDFVQSVDIAAFNKI